MADVAHDIPRMSAAEYLQMEKQATNKHEFFNGIVYATGGVSREHDLIAGDAFAAISAKLEPPCLAFTSDMKIRIRDAADECFYYPDLSVTCSQLDNNRYEIAQPSLIVEVLSRSTEDADRGYKFEDYKKLPSLQEYVLVHQERARIEVYRRRANWQKETFESGDEITLESVRITIAVSAFYRRVTF